MKVAVTGAAGFLGANLLRELVKRGHDVTAIDLVRFAIPSKVISAALPVLEPIAKLFGSDRVSRAAIGALISAPLVDGSKAEAELGYRPRPTEETVRDLVAFYKGGPLESRVALRCLTSNRTDVRL